VGREVLVGGRSEETESDRQQAPRTNHTRAPSPNSAPSKLTNQRILHLLPPVGCHHVSLDRSLTTNTLSHSGARRTDSSSVPRRCGCARRGHVPTAHLVGLVHLLLFLPRARTRQCTRSCKQHH